MNKSLYQLLCIVAALHQIYHASAKSITIQGSTSKLSTEIEYKFYNKEQNVYLKDGTKLGRDNTDTTNIDRWKIETTMWNDHYALRNVGTGKYLWLGTGKIAFLPFDLYLTTKSAASAYSVSEMKLDFVGTSEVWIPDSPNVKIRFNHNSGIVGIPKAGGSIYTNSDGDEFFQNTLIDAAYNFLKVSPIVGAPFDQSMTWAVIPLTIPPSCESVTSDQPAELKDLSGQLDKVNSVNYRNEDSVDREFNSGTKEITYTTTTTFTTTSSSQWTFGFNIGYELTTGNPNIASAKLSADYHMDWTYYKEQTEESTQSKSIKETIQIDIKCPARSICKREVRQYKPSSDVIPITVTAICDGITYTIPGQVEVDGVVEYKVIDYAPIPIDCEHYTNNYGDIGNGKLPFCNTCTTNTECEICQEKYILLDGQCITASNCQNVCGGQVKGEGADGIKDEIPESGGWCEIQDETKHNSKECGEVLGQ